MGTSKIDEKITRLLNDNNVDKEKKIAVLVKFQPKYLINFDRSTLHQFEMEITNVFEKIDYISGLVSLRNIINLSKIPEIVAIEEDSNDVRALDNPS
ncbi:MAG TPA: hypothetical protein VJ767_00750 [Nitrososphaeraceae archaeon]|nr:hypothetical protein [Nitrososphaeraceae archaeon]